VIANSPELCIEFSTGKVPCSSGTHLASRYIANPHCDHMNSLDTLDIIRGKSQSAR
jgi:hypothetical protein